MSDDEAYIEVTEGPDRGARLKVAADFAKAAIKAGWARDANEQPGEPEDVTPEARGKRVAAAIAGMRKLRGEDVEDATPAAAEADEADDADEEEAAAGEYETTDMQPARRGPGRPRSKR